MVTFTSFNIISKTTQILTNPFATKIKAAMKNKIDAGFSVIDVTFLPKIYIFPFFGVGAGLIRTRPRT
jgi:hypothetical protein